MTKTSVLLVYGGQSTEHDISLMSARNVYAALDDSRYDVHLCLIDRDGRWWLHDTVDDSHVGRPQLLPVLGQKKFVTLPEHHVIQPDVIFPILHGRNGEDGTVQGLAQLVGLPCVGPSLLSAAVTMDKDMTKRLMEQAGIPVVPWRTWLVKSHEPTYEEIAAELGNELFIKPASAGSSVGVSRVTSPDEWSQVLALAGKHSQMVLIETAVHAREIELAVMGNEEIQVSGAGEITPGEAFYSFEDKYAASSTAQTIVPADLSPDVVAQLQDYARRAYRATECRGMARVDFFIDQQGAIYLNEINSIPGFTNISMYPKLWRHAGISYPQLVSRLIDLALE